MKMAKVKELHANLDINLKLKTVEIEQEAAELATASLYSIQMKYQLLKQAEINRREEMRVKALKEANQAIEEIEADMQKEITTENEKLTSAKNTKIKGARKELE